MVSFGQDVGMDVGMAVGMDVGMDVGIELMPVEDSQFEPLLEP